MHKITKRFADIPVSHRHWAAKSHCRFVHGYARTVEITITADQLEQGWVFDFGEFKSIRCALEHAWDHRLLINSDDPLLAQFEEMHRLGAVDLHVMDVTRGWAAAIEGSCRFIYDLAEPIVREKSSGRARIEKVEIWESGANRGCLEVPAPAKPKPSIFEEVAELQSTMGQILKHEYPEALCRGLPTVMGGERTEVHLLSFVEGSPDARFRALAGAVHLDHKVLLNARRLVVAYYLPREADARVLDFNIKGARHAGYEIDLAPNPEAPGRQCLRCMANLPPTWLSNAIEINYWINDLVAMTRFTLLMMVQALQAGPEQRDQIVSVPGRKPPIAA